MKKPGVIQNLELITVMTDRSLKLWTRFKLSFIFSLVAMLISVTTFFFVSILIGDGSKSALADYGGNYFSFVLVGLAFEFYATATLIDYLKSVRAIYWNNWMEMVVTSPFSIKSFLVSIMTFSYLYATIHVLLYFVVGIGVFGADIPATPHILLILLILGLSILAISGLGIMSASMFLLTDAKGATEPIGYVIGTLAGVFSGVFFPISMIPPWLRPIGYVLPHTYALEGLRKAILTPNEIYWGSLFEWWSMWNILFVLTVFSIILVPLGLWMFNKSIMHGEKTGTLARWG